MPGRFAKLLAALPSMCALGGRETAAAATRLYMRAFWAARGVTVDPAARLIYERHELLALGAGVHVGPFSVVIALATPACVEPPLLTVGERTYIGDQVNIRAAGGIVAIGSDCLIANGVTIVASNHGLAADDLIVRQAWTRGDISIGDDVWIGAGAVILPGVRIGRGAVVGAGAVVREDVSDYAIVAGVPARVVGSRSSVSASHPA